MNESQPSIVERLRAWPATMTNDDGLNSTYVGRVTNEAADRIEELERDKKLMVAQAEAYARELADGIVAAKVDELTAALLAVKDTLERDDLSRAERITGALEGIDAALAVNSQDRGTGA